MTVYYPDFADKPATLKRESVLRHRDTLVADATALERRTAPSREEREMGLTAQDLQTQASAYRKDAARLTQVLACIDAGVAELPAELYPAGQNKARLAVSAAHTAG